VASWKEVHAEAPALAERVRRCFDEHIHKTIATLRKDGSPRISGNEVTFTGDEVWIGIMPGSRRAVDLERDPRIAIHSATVDPEMLGGDAKMSGRAVAVTDPAEFTGLTDAGEPGSFHLFKIDVTEIARTTVDGDRLVVESWREGRGVDRVERA
jgi:Pyridoxamine 5'-phosphate oxidase